MWPSTNVEAVCRVLGDTELGLTGSEIARLLAKLGFRTSIRRPPSDTD
jgi:hypothetical protein